MILKLERLVLCTKHSWIPAIPFAASRLALPLKFGTNIAPSFFEDLTGVLTAQHDSFVTSSFTGMAECKFAFMSSNMSPLTPALIKDLPSVEATFARFVFLWSSVAAESHPSASFDLRASTMSLAFTAGCIDTSGREFGVGSSENGPLTIGITITSDVTLESVVTVT